MAAGTIRCMMSAVFCFCLLDLDGVPFNFDLFQIIGSFENFYYLLAKKSNSIYNFYRYKLI